MIPAILCVSLVLLTAFIVYRVASLRLSPAPAPPQDLDPSSRNASAMIEDGLAIIVQPHPKWDETFHAHTVWVRGLQDVRAANPNIKLFLRCYDASESIPEGQVRRREILLRPMPEEGMLLINGGPVLIERSMHLQVFGFPQNIAMLGDGIGIVRVPERDVRLYGELRLPEGST